MREISAKKNIKLENHLIHIPEVYYYIDNSTISPDQLVVINRANPAILTVNSAESSDQKSKISNRSKIGIPTGGESLGETYTQFLYRINLPRRLAV